MTTRSKMQVHQNTLLLCITIHVYYNYNNNNIIIINTNISQTNTHWPVQMCVTEWQTDVYIIIYM